MRSIFFKRAVTPRRYVAICLMCALFLGVLVYLFYDHLFQEPKAQQRRVGITVPQMIGQSQEAASASLADAPFEVTTQYLHDRDVPEGVILRQTPAAGTYRKLSDGERIALQLTVSAGPAFEVVPTLVGKERREAQIALEALGFSVKTVRRTGKGIGQNTPRVYATDPPAGRRMIRGDTVTLYVNEPCATPSVHCPDLVGLDRMSALASLRAAGLTVGSVTTVRSDERYDNSQTQPNTPLSAFWASDVVVWQNRPAGSFLPQGSAVDIVLQRNDFFNFSIPYETNRKDSLFYG